jgi:hypothetical protein
MVVENVKNQQYRMFGTRLRKHFPECFGQIFISVPEITRKDTIACILMLYSK